MATSKAEFFRSLEWPIELNWIDSTGLYEFPDRARLARVEPFCSKTAGEYDGIEVTIINKTTGVVDRKKFFFDDYLDRAMGARQDRRLDYPHTEKDSCFVIIAHAGWKWYIAEPRDTTPFTNAISNYIGHFFL